MINEKIEELLTRGVENIYPSKDKLEEVLNSDKKLRIYYGIDPTGKLHLGHAIQLLKLRKFQDLGHEIIVLIGDFTARIGDPTGKSAIRVKLSKEEVEENARDYRQMIGKIIDTEHANMRFLHNEGWTNKLKPEDMLELASNFTVSQLLERDMFQERIKAGKEIYLHEFLYPLFQAYDAVTMDVDMQIGGNDQTFNMLAGRNLMKRLKNKEKFVLTTKMLVDQAGKKMGKSEGNTVPLDSKPAEMFGKIMSWSDELIINGFKLLTDISMEEINKIDKKINDSTLNPRDAKMRLAEEITQIFWQEAGAKQGKEHFVNTFQKKETPEDIKEVKVSSEKLLDILIESGLAASASEGKRLIEQQGIKVNSVTAENESQRIESGSLIQKGKREFRRIV